MTRSAVLLLAALCLQITVHAQELNPGLWQTIGRGDITWISNQVTIKDALITGEKVGAEAYSFSFEAKAEAAASQLQIWSGFGFKDRENYYTLGLRGGNSQDLYLARYESLGKDRLLALEHIDFDLVKDQWIKFRIVLYGNNILVYLNDAESPALVAQDKTADFSGRVVLGGGWTSTAYIKPEIRELGIEESASFDHAITAFTAAKGFKPDEAKRKRERARYKTQKIKLRKSGRSEVALSGNWLFIPEHELGSDIEQYLPEEMDESWHLLPVPGFWNPVRNWLHLQDSNLPHAGSGISDNYREKEEARVAGFTFDALQTNGGWYRHYIDLPKSISGKKLFLHFDAVSKVADVYVNGQYAGGHVGMFGEFELDITDFAKPGKNLIAVNVKVRKFDKAADADKNVARAVSVDINNDMLNSLPHGMFAGTEGGIWQPVKLIVTDEVRIIDQYAKTNLNGGDFEVTLKNEGSSSKEVQVRISARDSKTRALLFEKSSSEPLSIPPASEASTVISVQDLSPKLWSPESPNLYVFTMEVLLAGKVVDSKQIDIGFRTFETRGNRFYLNDQPYWLRSANHPPAGIAANDEALANRFFSLMHEGNQMVTRSHGSPFSETWMKAADKQGVGVSYEGSWPWLMIGDIPSEELLTIWKDEMLNLVKKYRNHPSLLMWTINNEMYFTMFYHNDPPEVRLKKWQVLSEVIKAIRELTPDIPISADSGYSRVEEDYQKNLAPHDIDDGDIDDRHVYFNWYNRDFFQVWNGEWDERIYWSPGANSERPFFSQETSTGYPNNDDGHFTRKYIFKHYVPHAWVGQWAWEDRNPAYGLQRHAFMTKELAELIRRKNPNTAGISLFANLSWYQNVHQSDAVKAYPVHDAVKLAYQPILVSTELTGRHYYAGSSFTTDIYIVNNALDGKNLAAGEISWSIKDGDMTLSSGKASAPAVAHYDREKATVKIDLPAHLPRPKGYFSLALSYQSGGQTVSENKYDLTLAEKNWINVDDQQKQIGVYDITGDTYTLLDQMGVSYKKLTDLTQIRLIKLDLLIVANLDNDNEVPFNWEDVKRMAGNGLNTLLIHPAKHLQWNHGDKIESIYERKGRVTHMHTPEHAVFDELEPQDLAWWQPNNNERPRAARRSFRLKKADNVTQLITYLRPHVYLGKPTEELPNMSGIPLLEIKEGKGLIMASEMELNQGTKDPVAAKLLANMINYLLKH